jgi:DNA-binding winged helix-turn-helix (wHTH) protein
MRALFSEYVFDSDVRLLLRAGEPVHLTPKAFQLLELLIESRPRPVSKRDLLERLWPDTFVAEGSLANLVSEIRTALREGREGTQHIRTVHRFGYAFTAPVTDAPTYDVQVRTPPPYRLIAPTGEIALAEGENLIGRDAECRVRIASSTVSRRHARLSLVAGEAILEDLSSKNGTWVNDTAVHRPVRLTDGDTFRVGSVSLVYRVFKPESSTDSFILSERKGH